MDFSNIETFLVIASSKSISDAADKLFITQSTASHRLQALEMELGTSLLVRQKGVRQMELTPAGKQFTGLAEQWISLWKKTQLLKEHEKEMMLTVAGTNRLNLYTMMPLYRQLSQTSVTLNIRTQQSLEIYSLVESREVDVGFVNWEMRCKNIQAKEILKERLVVIAGEELSGKNTIHPEQLQAEKEIYLASNLPIQAWHEYWWDPGKNPYVSVDNASLVRNYIEIPGLWTVCPISVAVGLKEILPTVRIYELEVDAPPMISYMLVHRNPKEESLRGIQILEKTLSGFLNSVLWSVAYD